MTDKTKKYSGIRFITENAQPTKVLSKKVPEEKTVSCSFFPCPWKGKKTDGYSRISEKTPLMERFGRTGKK